MVSFTVIAPLSSATVYRLKCVYVHPFHNYEPEHFLNPEQCNVLLKYNSNIIKIRKGRKFIRYIIFDCALCMMVLNFVLSN